MECSIYDSTLTRTFILSNYVSLIWQEQYAAAGKFQLVVNKSKELINALPPGVFVGIPGHDTLMYVQSVEDKDNQLWLYGAESKILLDDRVYNGTINGTNVETSLRTAFNAAVPYGVIALDAPVGLTATVDSRQDYKSLYELSVVWCERAGYGFRFRHDKANKKLLYGVYSGVTRNNYKFSVGYGNAANFKRTRSIAGYKNVALVKNAGAAVYAGDTASTGLARKEVFADGTGMSNASKINDRGLDTLTEHAAADEVSFELLASSGFGADYKLGDVVIFTMPEYGESASVRITGYTETWENNEHKIKIETGTPVIRRK